jgi:hypothetical protein
MGNQKNTCLFCDRAQYLLTEGKSDGVAPTVCALTVAPFFKKVLNAGTFF